MAFNRLGPLLGAAAVVFVLGSACIETSVEPIEKAPRTIAVNGTGEVFAEPDIAHVTMGVEVRADTVSKARREAAKLANDVVAVLRAKGVNEHDIRTINFHIRPLYKYRGDSPPLVIGYLVSNDVKVTVRDIEWLGELVDEVAARAGDSVRINDLSFAHEDPTTLAQQARELAIADARAKAQQIAEHTGMTLGSPLTIVEASWATPFAAPARAEMTTFDGGTSIQPGSSVVSISVQTTWEILEILED